MGSTNQQPSRKPFLAKPYPGETVDEFTHRVMALMGHGAEEDDTSESADSEPNGEDPDARA